MTDTFPPIGIMGPAGHGKTTVAKMLCEYGGRSIVGFAQPLKSMLGAIGLTHDDLYGDYKETPHPILCGKTPRFALQRLGTEWGRQIIGSDIWVNAWRYRVEGSGVVRAVADDVRFENEVQTIRDLGGEIWVVRDPRKEVLSGHPSEGYWSEVKPDFTITNDGSVEYLRERVRMIVQELQEDIPA